MVVPCDGGRFAVGSQLVLIESGLLANYLPKDIVPPLLGLRFLYFFLYTQVFCQGQELAHCRALSGRLSRTEGAVSPWGSFRRYTART